MALGFGKKLAGFFVESNEAPASDDAKAPSTEEIDAMMAELTATSTPSVGTAAPPAANPTATVELGDMESVSFEDIYQKEGVPTSPKTAEDLLKLLDGMKQMDDATRRQFIAALDQAEAHWEIKHPVTDAEHKINALTSAKDQLNQQVASAKTQAEANIAAEDTYLTQAEVVLKEQIAELEAELENEKKEVGERKEAIEKSATEKRAACDREQIRFDAEISRLRILPNTWGPHLNQAEAPTS